MNLFETRVVFEALRKSSTVNELESIDHGPGHWARVWENGRKIGQATEGCDLLVVDYFALFHDTMRENEFHDPAHGQRGAQLAEDLGVREFLNAEQYATLINACVHHDAGQTSQNPTLGVCWDADRLDLPRVGIQPDKRFFSTLAGKDAVDALTTL